MNRANPDIARLQLDEIDAVPEPHPPNTKNNHVRIGSPSIYVSTSPTSNSRHAEQRPSLESATESRPASPASPGTAAAASSAGSAQTPPKKPPLQTARSNASVASHSGDSTPRRLTPANSVLELKRFFGKGRTKHEHGVKIKGSADEKKKRPTFNLFGLRKKKPSINLHHHHSHSHEHHGNDVATPGAVPLAPAAIPEVHIKGHPPADLDPNFVVHGPDYEADWDPFHVFGFAPNSERLPFLESGITKYGEIGRDMGSGAGGSVRMMERPSDNKVFAVKEFRARRPNETPQKYAKHMTAEYALGAALHHKNIIETIDLIKEGDKYYEVMEYGPHDFFEVVMSGGMTTPQVNSAFKQIVNGLAYLHSMGVAHRDLKLDNCVVTMDGTVKLIDFGSAVIFKYPMSPQIHLARGILGSDPYLAPEVFLKHPYQPQCADVWSCGIIYCCTYLRRFPWKLPQREDASFRKFSENPANTDGKHPPQENAKKITGPWRLLRLLPRDSRPLIVSILKIPVEERATIEDVQNNAWFCSIQEISVLPSRYNPNEHNTH